MSSNVERAQRWMDRALGRANRDLAADGTLFYEGDTVYSYGHHFPMAIVMRERPNTHYAWRESSPTIGEPQWVLVNGDNFSSTTSRHQAIVRSVIANNFMPSLIVPFTALDAAGIERTSIEILQVREDRVERWTEEVEPKGANLRSMVYGDDNRPMPFEPGVTRLGAGQHGDGNYNYVYEEVPNRRWVRATNNGAIAERETPHEPWRVERTRHWLGDSLFIGKAHGRRRRFLSSFDYQESRPLYFLCELPRSSRATTVEQAYEDLKPDLVKEAERAGMEVTRQGDMFAVPTELSTREAKMLTPHRKGRIVKRPRRGLLGTNHTASEVLFGTCGRVYARGLLYHAPGLRDPDHARRKMGDGRTWHLLVKNTVPQAKSQTRTREVA